MPEQFIHRIPSQLIEKMKKSPDWGHQWDYIKKTKQHYLNGLFRTSLGEEIDLIFSEDGIIEIQYDLSVRPEGMRTPSEFTFKDEDIVAWCAKCKAKTGWWPWQWRWEIVELVSIRDSNPEPSPSFNRFDSN